jgi:hypothetical protein
MGTTSTSIDARYALALTAVAPGFARTVSTMAAPISEAFICRGSPTISADRRNRSTCSSSRKMAGPRGVSWTLI